MAVEINSVGSSISHADSNSNDNCDSFNTNITDESDNNIFNGYESIHSNSDIYSNIDTSIINFARYSDEYLIIDVEDGFCLLYDNVFYLLLNTDIYIPRDYNITYTF